MHSLSSCCGSIHLVYARSPFVTALNTCHSHADTQRSHQHCLAVGISCGMHPLNTLHLHYHMNKLICKTERSALPSASTMLLCTMMHLYMACMLRIHCSECICSAVQNQNDSLPSAGIMHCVHTLLARHAFYVCTVCICTYCVEMHAGTKGCTPISQHHAAAAHAALHSNAGVRHRHLQK